MLRVARYFSAKFNDTDTNNQRFMILKEVCPNRIERGTLLNNPPIDFCAESTIFRLYF